MPLFKDLGRSMAILSLFIGSLFISAYSPSTTDVQKYEFTAAKMSDIKNFNTHNISVFGVSIGMRMEEVEEAIAKYDFLYLEDDKLKANRLYLYDVDGRCLAYFIWEGDKFTMDRLVIYDDIVKYLKGINADLFSREILNPSSEYAKVLGRPDHAEVTMRVKSIDLYQTSYFYSTKHLEVIKQKYHQTEEFMLVFHEV